MGALANVTESTFQREVLESDGLVLVDFWAPWCGPCKLIGPVLEELAVEYAGTIKIAKVNVDENQNLAGQYGIRSIPSLLFLRGGKIVDTVVGAWPKQRLAEKIESLRAR
jgi:thioredoxin 1